MHLVGLIRAYWRQVQIVLALLLIALMTMLLGTAEAHATWKPEYGKHDPKVIRWFETRILTSPAHKRLHYDDCCKTADRLMTKVIAGKGRNDEDQWYYYVDPSCTSKGCELRIIPADTIHDDPIPSDPEFKQLRAEGVLFIYQGQVTCFWRPESGN